MELYIILCIIFTDEKSLLTLSLLLIAKNVRAVSNSIFKYVAAPTGILSIKMEMLSHSLSAVKNNY